MDGWWNLTDVQLIRSHYWLITCDESIHVFALFFWKTSEKYCCFKTYSSKCPFFLAHNQHLDETFVCLSVSCFKIQAEKMDLPSLLWKNLSWPQGHKNANNGPVRKRWLGVHMLCLHWVFSSIVFLQLWYKKSWRQLRCFCCLLVTI